MTSRSSGRRWREGRDLGQIGFVGQDRRSTRVGETVLERLLAEQREERQRDHPRLVAGEMRDRGLGRLREEDGEALAASDAVGGERIGEPARKCAHVGEAVALEPSALLEEEKCRGVARCRGVALAAGDRHVEGGRHAPAEALVHLVVALARLEHARPSSFETPPSAAPQDEAGYGDEIGPHPEEAA